MHTTITSLSMRIAANAHVRLTDVIARRSDERGDVPGWVLVAVMTAGLVTAIWLIADDQLTAVLDRAISSVSTP